MTEIAAIGAGRYVSAAERTRRKFEAKVAILEEWAANGKAPAGKDWPRGPVALARWADQELGLESWASPNVGSPGGPYPELRARFDEAVRRLTRHDPGRLINRAAASLAHLRAHNVALCEQIEEVRARHQKDREEMDRLRTRLAIAEARGADLAVRLATIVPIRSA